MNTSRANLRAVTYARISEDTTGEGIGVRRQQQACAELATARGWEVVAEATDNDVSALRGKARPGYQHVLDLVRSGAVEYVVVWQTSRLLRNRKERAEAIELLGRQQVGIISVKGQDLDLSNAYGRGMAGMLGEFDTMESEVKSERVLAAAADRAKSGRPNGSLGYGWEKIGTKATARYEVDPIEAEVVVDITRRLISGESVSGVTADLNRRGVSAPNSPTWGKTSVRKLAMRPANAAVRVHHRGRPTETTYEGDWPALVARKDWEQVVSVLTTSGRQTNGPVRPGARKHLLTWGIGACGVCGGYLRVAWKGNARHGVKRRLYLCEAKGCVGRDEERVDEVICGIVVARLSADDALDWLLGDDEEARRQSDRAAELRRRLDDAADQYGDGKIDGQQLERITAKITPDLAEAERLRDQASRAVDRAVLRDLAGPAALEVWESLAVPQQRAVLEALGMVVKIDRVTRRGPGFDPESVRIEWRGQA